VRKLIAGLKVHICDECVGLCNEILAEDVNKELPAEESPRNLRPEDIKTFLDGHVVGQEIAKKSLAVAVYNHYKRIRSTGEELPDGEDDDVELTKGNVLLVGPTGSGKTYMAQCLAKLLDVPFTIVDATCLTEAGYVGEDVENIIKNLWLAAGKDTARAAKGIVCIDEIDKITRKGDIGSYNRDVGGEGVQQALLKMVESELVMIPPEGNRNRPQQDFVQVDTTDILFIACGAFQGLKEVVERRVGNSSVGFGAELGSKEQDELLTKTLRLARGEDLVGYGMIPEFVGRFPVIVPFDPLDTDALAEILWRPKNSLVRQYQKLFDLERVKLKFTDDALMAIAKDALGRKSGARGLRSILEEIMLDIMYDLPALTNLRECVINEDVVTKGEQPLLVLSKESA
jgi:ATP-dependent Clp protease ATP-binding subunit ClpX